MIEVVDRLGGIAGGIFDRPADKTSIRSQSDGFGGGLGCVAVTILKIGSDGQVGCSNDSLRVGQRFVARDTRGAVAASEGKGQPRAGCGEGFKPQPSENSRCACVPGICDHKDLVSLVQGLECSGLLRLSRHSLFSV